MHASKQDTTRKANKPEIPDEARKGKKKMKKFQDLHVFNCIRFYFDGDEYRTLVKEPQINDEGVYQAYALDENNNQFLVTWKSDKNWYEPDKVEGPHVERPRHKVVGMSYGKEPNGRIVHFSQLEYNIGKRPVALRVFSQYGWEDKFRERNVKYIKNPRCCSWASGDLYTLSAAIIKGEEITEEEFKSLAEH